MAQENTQQGGQNDVRGNEERKTFTNFSNSETITMLTTYQPAREKIHSAPR
jgi:hypothetical protein